MHSKQIIKTASIFAKRVGAEFIVNPGWLRDFTLAKERRRFRRARSILEPGHE